jgi:predicted DNA binding CopG/RHH family protein
MSNPMITANTAQIAIRIPHAELEAARARAKETGRTFTKVVVDALHRDRLDYEKGKVS